MTPDDLQHLHLPGDPRLSPNGDRLVFVVSTPDLEEDRYDRQIWLSDAEGTGPLTNGPSDGSPRWSPDGRHLAFVREADGKPQAHLLPVDGGEARQITHFDLGVEALEWSPDGSRICVVAVSYSGEWEELDDDERARRPRRVLSVPYRFDGKGPIHDRRRHLWLIDPNGSEEPSQLTQGDHDEEFPAWAPDGGEIAFISDRDPRQGLLSGNDVWTVDVASGDLSRVTERGMWSQVSYSPDGRLHLLGNTDPHYPVNFYLHVLERDGSLTCLTDHLDRSGASLSAGPAAIRWDGESALVGYEDSGRFGLIRVLATGETETMVSGERAVLGFDCAAGRIVFAASDVGSPGEVYSLEDGDESRITDLDTDDIGLVTPDHFTVESEGVEIDVWVYLPDGDEQVPTLLNIHGGPASQYGFGFFDEFQVYVGAGYGVIACNPRGSSGRGTEFLEAVEGEAWGRVDLADIRAAVAGAMGRYPRLDPDRLGVMGGSYGGFLTAWLIAHEDRWKSAVVERALLSWTSFSGTSDIGGVFGENYLLETYPGWWSRLWEKSPLALADRVSTPTLILHAEDDFRCPIEQAEQYFMALLRNGTTTEMLRFPGEGHEMSRSGKPRHRKERLEAILDWHARHLS